MFSVSNAEVRLLAWEKRPGVSGDYSNKASSPSRFKISIEWRKGFEMDGENTKFMHYSLHYSSLRSRNNRLKQLC